MAYRFMRHGLYTRRTKFNKNGFRPIIDDLMWDITDWHYKHYMRRVVRNTILSHQKGNI